MFGRRRSGGASKGDRGKPTAAPGPELADDLEPPAAGQDDGGTDEPQFGGGPWDAADTYPELPRADFGSLLVPWPIPRPDRDTRCTKSRHSVNGIATRSRLGQATGRIGV